MIKLFLKDLPYTLTQPMYREYDEKCRELERWADYSRSKRVKKYLSQREMVHFFFALGIYYRYVIAPLTSSANFFERLETSNNASLKIGGRKIDSSFRNSIQTASSSFQNVMQNFGMTTSFFAQTDVRKIVIALIEIEERKKNEQAEITI